MLVLQTLPGAFLHIAQCLKEQKLRSDFRHRLLSLYSDVGLVAEAKNGRFRINLISLSLNSDNSSVKSRGNDSISVIRCRYALSIFPIKVYIE